MCIQRKSEEHQLGNFFSTCINQNFLLLWFFFFKATYWKTCSLLTIGAIVFYGTVMDSFSYLMFVESRASPTIDRCTAFSWRRLKLSARGEEIWAVSTLELRWKSFCHILTALETSSSTKSAHYMLCSSFLLCVYVSKLIFFFSKNYTSLHVYLMFYIPLLVMQVDKWRVQILVNDQMWMCQYFSIWFFFVSLQMHTSCLIDYHQAWSMCRCLWKTLSKKLT